MTECIALGVPRAAEPTPSTACRWQVRDVDEVLPSSSTRRTGGISATPRDNPHVRTAISAACEGDALLVGAEAVECGRPGACGSECRHAGGTL